MKRIVIILIVLISTCSLTVLALSNNFNFDTSKLSFTKNSKKSDVLNSFNKDYNLSYSISNEDEDVVEDFKNLAKKTTYLLLGDFNNTDESSEDFYKRKQEWKKLRYNPDIPKDPNNIIGLDIESKEYIDDMISGMAITQIFNQASEYGLIYGGFGDIRVTIYDEIVICSTVLTNAKTKEIDPNDPTKYTYKDTNYTFYYYYKKLNDEWKLYYLYGEDTDQIEGYFDEVDSNESKSMSIAPSYQSELSTIYSFEKLEQMSQDELDNIYNSNINNIVYLNGYYNNKVVSSANGFFINKNLVVTTWSFLEKTLINAQYLTAGGNDTSYEIEGIVTANPSVDLAVLKIKDVNKEPVRLGDSKNVNKEDPAIILSSKLGVGCTVQTGIIISNSDYIQTSIPLSTSDEGSPLFNQSGEVIGINTSKSVNSSISISVNSEPLIELQNKFNNIDNIDSITFEELKEKYYYVKLDEEQVKNNIPEKKWNEFSKIGNIKENIKLELVKASYKDNIISLRYKNGMSNFIGNIQIAASFVNQLVKDGYELSFKSDSKLVYTNNDYQVIIMDEFDYLIIVMVKL